MFRVLIFILYGVVLLKNFVRTLSLQIVILQMATCAPCGPGQRAITLPDSCCPVCIQSTYDCVCRIGVIVRTYVCAHISWATVCIIKVVIHITQILDGQE